MAEPDTGRTSQIGNIRNYNFGAGAGIDTKELTSAKEAVDQLSASVDTLAKAFATFNQNADRYSNKLEQTFKKIKDSAKDAADQVARLGGAVGGTGSSSSGVTPAAAAAATGSSTGSGTASAAAAIASASTASAGRSNNIITSLNAFKDRNLIGGASLGTFLGNSDELLKDMALSPLRWFRDRISTNRDTAIMTSGAMGSIMMQQGMNNETGQRSVMQQLSQRPGGIYGNVQDFLNVATAAPSLGASFNFSGQPGMQGKRASGFWSGIQQLQQMSPTADVGSLVDTLGGYAGNTKAQQQAVMLTGGAMSIIGTGGRQKSIPQWADGILKWLEGLRPGGMRGQPFTNVELMAQYFPGSNIDAWLNASGVTPGMKEAFWTYALAKSSTAESQADKDFKLQAAPSNVAYSRLKSTSELTKTEFDLAGNMSGVYANREQANEWFNSLMGKMTRTVVPAIAGNKGLGSFMQFMPDTIEDLLMTLVERGSSELFGDQPEGVGIGDSYGEFGGTGLSGLHPDMKAKVGRMMRANPRLTMTSSLRDTGLQQKLKAKGHSNVSGKPSAHTRGMAADLGPSSQYGWIAANASKFGLASGKSFGEPWHVGMKGDVGDPFDFLGGIDFGLFDKATDWFSGITSGEGGIGGFIQKIMTSIFGKLGGLFGGGTASSGAVTTAPSYDPNMLTNLIKGKTDFQIGIPASKSGMSPKELADALAQPGALGPYDTLSNFFTQVLTGLGVPASALNLDKMGAVAKQEGYVKGAYNPWNSNSGPGTDRNSAGIKKYPDEATGVQQTIALLSSQSRNRPAIIDNLKHERSFEEFIAATDVYYNSWSKPGEHQHIAPSQKQGHDYLTTTVGDMPPGFGMADMMFPTMSRGSTPVVFQNTFHIGSGGGGSSNGGIDARYTATVIADHLENEMKKRLARAS